MSAGYIKNRFFTALLILCIILPALIACRNRDAALKKPCAVKGVLDLSRWDFKADGPVRLNGEWEFYWNRLPEPADFTKPMNEKGFGFIAVPSLWKDRKVNGVSLPGTGYATYRLKIINFHDNTRKTLIIHRIFSAYKLWINGMLVAEAGKTDRLSKNKEYYIYIHNKQLSSFTPVAGANEIIFQVFNFDYESGGINRSILLEDEGEALQDKFQQHTVSMVVFGLLLFASVYNILFYFFRRQDAASLYFGLFCLAMAINTFNHQFPLLYGLLYLRNPYLINYLTVIAAMPFCMMTVKSLFPDEFSGTALRINQGLSAAFFIMLFFVKFGIAEQAMKVYFISVAIFVLYSMNVFIMAIKNRRDDAALFMTGFTPVFIGAINDILYAMWIINTTVILQYGIIILCITTTIVISRRFSRALRTVEELSEDLEEKNISLEKMDRLKDQFLANTSHELRTPLHGIIGLSESMIDGAAGGLTPKAIENLSLISSSGHRLANMVNDLLDMAKIQDKGLNLALRPVNLYSLTEMVVKMSLPLTGEKPVEIVNSIEPDIPAAHADEDRIRQVLYNLIGNAIKFTNKGTIAISARLIDRTGEGIDDDPGKIIEVSVSDTGIGIPDEYREKIFEAYEQVDGSDTRPYSGTGLGLAIAKQIVELHNGTICAVSGDRGGSVFIFTLPVSKEVAETTNEIIIESMCNALQSEDGNDLRLPAGLSDAVFTSSPVMLVVDDDPVNVRVIQNYFESKGCVIKTAENGMAGLEIIESDDSIDLVLLDIMMPVMSGYEVCRRIRSSHTPEDLPVIMLTAKNMMADIDAAFKAGANDYIVKPFRISELLARVSTMLKLRNIRKSEAEGITIRSRNETYSLPFSDIIYITSHLKNSIIHTEERDIEVPVIMKEIANKLPPDIFVRIHKSHIINLRYIHSISHVLSGRYKVRLSDSDETELPVGAAFLNSLRKKI